VAWENLGAPESAVGLLIDVAKTLLLVFADSDVSRLNKPNSFVANERRFNPVAVSERLVPCLRQSSDRLHLPMRRNLPQPLDAGVLHGGVRVEALGDGAGDEGGAPLPEQLDQPLLLRHQRIDPRRLPVEEGGDGAFLANWC